jgi:polyketide cyclase/dehydrase/lipid transport protein
MPRYQVSESAIIHAPPAKVYGILSDYRQHHPRILPPQYFRNLQVLEGGVGAGTKTKFEVRVFGTRREIVHVVAEPEPGRVLTESDPEGVSTTRFTLDPLEGGTATRLTIDTELVSREGAAGALERWMTAMMLRRIYRAELARIEAYAPGVAL